ncbi:hypothetical protein N8D56_19215 [Devosia sp. A8/3-2]|nr:hypothetical protein N8D56_19215 [Devosia sp. A8/3-2]
MPYSAQPPPQGGIGTVENSPDRCIDARRDTPIAPQPIGIQNARRTPDRPLETFGLLPCHGVQVQLRRVAPCGAEQFAHIVVGRRLGAIGKAEKHGEVRFLGRCLERLQQPAIHAGNGFGNRHVGITPQRGQPCQFALDGGTRLIARTMDTQSEAAATLGLDQKVWFSEWLISSAVPPASSGQSDNAG